MKNKFNILLLAGLAVMILITSGCMKQLQPTDQERAWRESPGAECSQILKIIPEGHLATTGLVIELTNYSLIKHNAVAKDTMVKFLDEAELMLSDQGTTYEDFGLWLASKINYVKDHLNGEFLIITRRAQQILVGKYAFCPLDREIMVYEIKQLKKDIILFFGASGVTERARSGPMIAPPEALQRARL